MAVNYIIVAKGPGEEIEDIAVCDAYSTAKEHAERFASIAPPTAVVTIYEGKLIAGYSGRAEPPDSMTPAQGGS